MQKTRFIRNLIFLREVLWMALTGFGGPNVHFTLFLKTFVQKRKYLSEEELMELQALCQILPGPTSTQTITAIGFRIGGPVLAYFTLIVWIFPACSLMALAAFAVSSLDQSYLLKTTRFIKPMGVSFIFYAAYVIGQKVITSKTSWILMILATALAYVFRSPYVTPAFIVIGGFVASFNYNKFEKKEKEPIKIDWKNFVWWAVIFVASITIGSLTKNLPVRLFENFYRNGSLAFGGGHIMKPLLFNEFVEFKSYLSSDEFLSGIAIGELVPGPTFSIASFIGSLSMRDWGISGQILGAAVASIGIFLPGILMIFFFVRFWDQMKQYRGIRASLVGVNASSTGLTIAAGISLIEPMSNDNLAIFTVTLSFLLLLATKIPTYVLIIGGLILGFLV